MNASPTIRTTGPRAHVFAFLVAASFAAAGTAEGSEEPVWWFGVAGAANLNVYDGTTQRPSNLVITPAPFHKGFGIGAYLAPSLEYRPDDHWGGMLQFGYDDRRGRFDEILCPCGETATLAAKPAYLSLEPSLRWSPFGSGRTGGFHVFAGPRLAVLWGPLHDEKRFAYRLDGSPAIRSDFSAMRGLVYSAGIGVGHDLDLTGFFGDGRTRIHLAPFASYQPRFGQDPRDTDRDREHWALSTLRIGAVLKFGRRKPLAETPDLRFSVRAPATVVKTRRIEEIFPLRNYVYFEEDSVSFPGRYARLSVDEARAFREAGLSDRYPAAPTGRSARQLAVYRHILNIMGDRLRRHPHASITLVGLNARAADAPRLGAARAGEVKGYLMRAFGIEGARITVEERPEPPPPLARTEAELAMLRAEGRRVEILTSSPELLLQVGEGERFMLKPVEVEGEAPGNDSVVFVVSSETPALRRALARSPREPAPGADAREERGGTSPANTGFSWTLTVTDLTAPDSGMVRRYGPFTGGRAVVPAAVLLGQKPRARFSATMTGQHIAGKDDRNRRGEVLIRTAPFALSQRHEGLHVTLRYGILFDIDQARAVSSYDRFLAAEVAPRLTDSATVYIRGRTDVIAPVDYNLALSRERAEGVLARLREAAARDGRQGVRFAPSWSGEDPRQAPFGNVFPEERNYNRTVIIDIVPR